MDLSPNLLDLEQQEGQKGPSFSAISRFPPCCYPEPLAATSATAVRPPKRRSFPPHPRRCSNTTWSSSGEGPVVTSRQLRRVRWYDNIFVVDLFRMTKIRLISYLGITLLLSGPEDGVRRDARKSRRHLPECGLHPLQGVADELPPLPRCQASFCRARNKRWRGDDGHFQNARRKGQNCAGVDWWY